MKTIMDAVNELNAEWVYKDSISAYFRPAIPCDSGYWYYGESKPFNDEHVCTLEEFSECVSECSFNFGKCSHAEFNAWLEATKQHYSEAEKPVFTQAMCDAGELPQVGSDVIYNTNTDGDVVGTVTHYKTKKSVTKGCSKADYRVFIHFKSNARLLCDIKPIDNRTPEDIALDDIAGCRHVSKERESNRNILNAIKENKIHGVTWTGK